MNVFCKSHSHHGRKLHSLPTKKKTKQNKTFPKDNLREDSETLAFNSIPDPKRKKKKERISKSLLFFSITTCMRKSFTRTA
jgi:hypothetical protein